MNLLPEVLRKGSSMEFDAAKIYNSLLNETSLTPKEAKHICELTTRRIISNNIAFLSGPHIREIVCSILSENNYSKERKQYSTSRIALADFPKIRKIYTKKVDYHKAIAFMILCEERVMRRLIRNDKEQEAG